MVTPLTFDPALVVQHAAYEFLCLAGDRRADGLWGSVQVVNGSPQWADWVLLGTEAGRAAGTGRILRRTQLDGSLVERALLELNLLAEARMRGEAPGAEDWAPPAPFTDLPVPPFPFSKLLVPALSAFVAQTSAAYETPYDFAGLGVLAALSIAIGNRARIHIDGEVYQSACLWSVLVGRPGSGKSDPLEKALAPLRAVHDAYMADYAAQQEAYEQDLQEWESAKRDLRPEKPKPPAVQRVFVSDVTMEALALDLLQNPLGMGLYRDELSAVLAGFDRYRPAGSGSDRSNFLETWSGKTIDVSRKTGGRRVIYVKHPYLPIVGTIQPDRLIDLLGRLEDGFLDRLLVVYPPASVAPLPRHAIDAGVLADYAALLRGVLDQRPDLDGHPHLVQLSAPGRVRFRERAAVLEEELRAGRLAPSVYGAFAKLRIYASRLVLILQQACWAAGLARAGCAEVAHVDAAWDLISYFQGHVRKVHLVAGADPELEDAQAILEVIRRKGWTTCSRRDLYVALDWRFRRPEAADPALKLLEAMGYLREQPGTYKGRGRPPSPTYLVNPRQPAARTPDWSSNAD